MAVDPPVRPNHDMVVRGSNTDHTYLLCLDEPCQAYSSDGGQMSEFCDWPSFAAHLVWALLRSVIGQRYGREEVAQLAGVGLVWYTWLKQGRDVNVSSEVLERLYVALELSQAEHEHLFALATTALHQILASKAERSHSLPRRCSAGLQMRHTLQIRGGMALHLHKSPITTR